VKTVTILHSISEGTETEREGERQREGERETERENLSQV
jgi:hypothetical protein